MKNYSNITAVGSNATAQNESLITSDMVDVEVTKIVNAPQNESLTTSDVIDVEVTEVADASFENAKTPGNYSRVSRMPFQLTATKLAQAIMIYGNPYGRYHFGYFFHDRLIQECKRLIPVPINGMDKNGLKRLFQTYENNRGAFPCIDRDILLAILERSELGGCDEDL